MNQADVVIFRVTSIHDATSPPQWAGRSGVMGVDVPKASPVGLRGWKSREEARKDLALWLNLSSVIGGCPWRYEMVVFGPKVAVRA